VALKCRAARRPTCTPSISAMAPTMVRTYSRRIGKRLL
jgi:hypothetical protein